MRLDYALYVIAVVLFILTGIMLAYQSSMKELWTVTTFVLGLLFLALGSPKQEKWIYQHKDRLNVSFIAAVGAVFDFYVGTVKRSHPWFLEHGLEWLPRLIQEPQRLWDRTFISAPLFLVRVLIQRISGK